MPTGMFSGALISAAVACELPGPGTIYIGQQMSFQKPVKIGDTLTVRLEILEKLPKFRVRIATRVFNQRDELVVGWRGGDPRATQATGRDVDRAASHHHRLIGPHKKSPHRRGFFIQRRLTTERESGYAGL